MGIKSIDSYYRFNRDQINILNFLSFHSKNVYNCFIYTTDIYYKFKYNIYSKILNSKKVFDEQSVEKKIYELFEFYYNMYSKIKNDINSNNRIIYHYINENLKNTFVTHLNYNDLIEKIIRDVHLLDDIITSEEYNKYLIDDIVTNIIKSRYLQNYREFKEHIINHKPLKYFDAKFSEHVKTGKYVFSETKDLKPLLEKKYFISIKSDQNIISRVAYKHIGEHINHLPSDIITNIFRKAFEGYKSFFELKKLGIRCNAPKYLEKNGKYGLFYFDRSKKEVDIDGKKYIRLTVGQYVSDNYKEVTKNNDYVCINPTAKTYKKYKEPNKKIIQDGYYLYIRKPSKLNDIKLQMTEIQPLYNGYQYRVIYRYKDDLKPKFSQTKISNNYVSGDLGIKNLLVLYDPTGKQYIIKGGKIISINHYFNKKIDEYKSIAKKQNNKNTTHRIHKLLIKRKNKIKEYFINLSNLIADKYKHKKKIILGYNKFWKNQSNMGKKMNREFYGIPYSQLINILDQQLRKKNIKLELIEESYTSKCDALGLEKICKHESYMGKRSKRGLFSSSQKKLINADLNGAINIMRKYMDKIGRPLTQINGLKLLNPKTITP